jgi:dihydroorotase
MDMEVDYSGQEYNRILEPMRQARSNSKVGAQKFTQSTKAYQVLKGMFETKQISATDKPSDIRSKDPLFMDFSMQQFRSQFNKLKSTFGTCTKEGKLSL